MFTLMVIGALALALVAFVAPFYWQHTQRKARRAWRDYDRTDDPPGS